MAEEAEPEMEEKDTEPRDFSDIKVFFLPVRFDAWLSQIEIDVG